MSDTTTAELYGGDYHDFLREARAGKPAQAPRVRAEVGDEGDDDDVDEPSEYDFVVTTPSGASFPVLTQSEVDYYRDRADRYMNDHRFTSVTDLQDLDRVLSSELSLYRYDIWLALNRDYFGNSISEQNLLRNVKDMSKTLMDQKKSMGLDKATRDKDQGADFVGWMEDSRRRAKAFMVMREEQFFASITLMHEVLGRLQSHFNADEVEREELGLQPAQVIQWLWDDVKPRFEAIDEHFKNRGMDPDDPDTVIGQRFWIEEGSQ